MRNGNPNGSWADAMADSDGDAGGLAGDGAQSLELQDSSKLGPARQVRMIRHALGLSQKKFSSQFQIPLGTLRDWEQGRKEPEAAARAYLVVIGRNPGAVAEALHPAI